jgi:hypothetical protein
MSTSWPQRSASIGARMARPLSLERKGPRAAAPLASPGGYNGRPRAVPDLPRKSVDDRTWDDERTAREVRRQELIEASLERAAAYERLGDFERALEWLDRAAAPKGGLPVAYRLRRARCARAAALRPGPADGDWKGRAARPREEAAGR